MTTNDYIQLSGQFENRSEEMIQRLAENFDVCHAAQGIGDEFLELLLAMNDAYNQEDELGFFNQAIVKEAGDVMWYIAILCRKFGYNLEPTAVIADMDTYPSTVQVTQRMLGALKKYVFYGKELDHNDMQFCINVIIRNMEQICNQSIDEILQRNYDKLYARYAGQSFTNEAAINKNEANE